MSSPLGRRGRSQGPEAGKATTSTALGRVRMTTTQLTASPQMQQPAATAPASEVPVRGWGYSSVGRIRKENQDAFWVDVPGHCFALADGMGGHAAGEVASAMMVEGIRMGADAGRGLFRRFESEPSDDHRRQVLVQLEYAVRQAHRAIKIRAREEQDKRGMGTTCDALVLVGTEAFIAHVGDSRIYLLRRGEVQRLTQDHTLAQALLGRGMITPEEAATSPQRSTLVNAVGVTHPLSVDVAHLDLRLGDRFILCSDGVHEYFPRPDELLDIADRLPGGGAVQQIVDLACERGGRDNATAVLVEYGDPSQSRVDGEALAQAGTLAMSPVFAGLSEDERLRVVRAAVERDLGKDEELSLPTYGRGVAYVVVDGAVGYGDGATAFGPGTLIDAPALVGGAVPPQRPHAIEHARVLALRTEDFVGLTHEDPAIGVKLLWNLIQAMGGAWKP
jgi:serine/threonine protein phosphatase PrpC